MNEPAQAMGRDSQTIRTNLPSLWWLQRREEGVGCAKDMWRLEVGRLWPEKVEICEVVCASWGWSLKLVYLVCLFGLLLLSDNFYSFKGLFHVWTPPHLCFLVTTQTSVLWLYPQFTYVWMDGQPLLHLYYRNCHILFSGFIIFKDEIDADSYFWVGG